MLVTLILTLCAGTVCTQQQPFDAMPAQLCAIRGQEIGSDWMKREGYEARGYVLARYGCRAVQAGRKDAI